MERSISVSLLAPATLQTAGDPDELVPTPSASDSSPAPRVVVDKDGWATAVWRKSYWDGTTSQYSIQSATRTRTIPFGTGTNVTTPSAESVHAPDLGVADSGMVTATWYRSVSGGGPRIEAASQPQGGSFGAVQTVSASSGSADHPEVKVNARGDVVVVWNRYIPAIGTRVIEAKVRPAGSSFDEQPVRILSAESDYSDFPDVAIDDNGNALAVWARRPKSAASPFSTQASLFDATAPTVSSWRRRARRYRSPQSPLSPSRRRWTKPPWRRARTASRRPSS